MQRNAISVVCFGFMLLTCGVISAAPPEGVDMHSPTALWYQSLHQRDSDASCCSVSDCRPVDAAWFDGSRWRVRIGNEIVDVPDDRIVNRENPVGRAIVCGSSTAIYCFVPPPNPGN
jgi:hypothetical protein